MSNLKLAKLRLLNISLPEVPSWYLPEMPGYFAPMCLRCLAANVPDWFAWGSFLSWLRPRFLFGFKNLNRLARLIFIANWSHSF